MYRRISRYFLALCLGFGLARAEPAPVQDWAALREAARQYLLERIRDEDPDLEAQIEIGPVDPRLRLPHCRTPRAFLPAGARLYGNGSLGMRCEEAPQPWTLYLSYRIALQGPALVARQPLAARQVLRAQDVELRRVTYEAPPGDYLRDPALLVGGMTSRPVAAGQALTTDRILRSQTVRAGQRVKVWLQGTGFRITQEGVALNGASPGETVRVRTDAGRIIQGQATVDGGVQVRP